MTRLRAAKSLTVESLDKAKRVAVDLLRETRRRQKDCRYVDLRIEIAESKSACAENGVEKAAQEDYLFSFGIRVLAGDRLPSPGYYGRRLSSADLPHLTTILRDGFKHAYDRAKEHTKKQFKILGESLTGLTLAPIEVRQDTIKAECSVDPRSVPLSEVSRQTVDVSRAVKSLGARIKFNAISTSTGLSRELFTSSEGALIDQSFATTLGFCWVVA
ncbi:MAG: TldD/PmbA family protein, partial [Nitrospiraceae bacterium]